MAESIEFRLKVIEDKLGLALDQNEKKAKSLGDTLSVAVGTFAGQAAIKGFSLLGNAIGSVNDFIFDSIKASAEQEAALNRLGQALKQTGDFSQGALDDFNAFASELQKSSVFADEVVLGQLAIAKSFGATNEQAKGLVQAAANLSAQLGGSLEENVFKLAKTLNGEVARAFKAAIPELKGLSQEALNAGGAIDIINQKFAGSAQAQLETYSGSLTALTNAFGDLQEIVGDTITQSDFVKGVFSSISEAINTTISSIQEYQAQQKVLNQGFVDNQSEINALSGDYADLTLEIEKQQAIINKQGPNKALVSTAEIQIAETKVKSLSAEAEKLFKIINVNQQAIALEDKKTGGDPAAKVREKTVQELAAIEERNIAIRELENQFALESNQFELEQDIAEKERYGVKTASDIEALTSFELTKSELMYQAAMDRASNLATIEEQEAAKSKAILDKKNRDQKIGADNKKKLLDQEIKDQEAFFSVATSLSSSKNKELAAIGKAAALYELSIKTPQAIASSYAFGTKAGGPILGATFGTIAGIAMAQQAAKIAGVSGFANGGIVGATSGPDNALATVRTGEMILNAEQQQKLFNQINNGSSNNSNIVIQIDGRNLAYAIRDQINQGFKLT